ncbi:MAG: hypothetical protein ACI92S_004774, partial [Planctomycetaceae bacterium]
MMNLQRWPAVSVSRRLQEEIGADMTAFALTEDRRRFGGVIRHGAVCMAVLVLLVLVGRFPAELSGRV